MAEVGGPPVLPPPPLLWVVLTDVGEGGLGVLVAPCLSPSVVVAGGWGVWVGATIVVAVGWGV